MYECFCVVDRVWWSLFTTSCQKGFSSFAAVLYCRQCSSLRATGLTSGENRSKFQPFRLRLNGFKESWWWAILINGRTFMISETASCIFYNLEQCGKRTKDQILKSLNITELTSCTIDLLYLSLTAATLYLFVVIATFVGSWLELEACSPRLRFVVYKTRHCPGGRYVHLYLSSAHKPSDAGVNPWEDEPMCYKSFTQPLLCWKMGGFCAKH